MDGLCQHVDRYRGMSGFYRGVQAPIQDDLLDVQLDWAFYAEIRLTELWVWRREVESDRAQSGEEMTIQKQR